jgi:hypothetical protein
MNFLEIGLTVETDPIADRMPDHVVILSFRIVTGRNFLALR